MANLFAVNTLPRTSADACREFDERYLAALSAAPAPSWAHDLGDVVDVATPMVSFPVSLMTARYQETNGDSRAKTVKEKSFDLRTVEFDDGIEVPLLGVNGITQNTFAYRQWIMGPSKFLSAEQRHVNRSIAAILQAGTSTASAYDGVNFFHASGHLANPADPSLGTWGNYQSVAKSSASIADILGEMAAMAGVKDSNGDLLGVMPDTIVVPLGKFATCNAEVSKQFLSAGESNPLYGQIKVVAAPELDSLDANDFYLVDSKLVRSQGLSPWVAARHMVPESMGLRYFDESSDFTKNTGKIKVSSHIWYGFAGAFPHAIRRVAGS